MTPETEKPPEPTAESPAGEGLASPSCSALELRRRIALNVDAIQKTARNIGEAVDDQDGDFALGELKNLLSQVGGLAKMLNSQERSSQSD